jgi:hypothetical protein
MLASPLLVSALMMTVVAYDAGPGTDVDRAWQLAIVQFLYVAGTVFYVTTVIRERDSLAFRWVSVGYHACALGAVELVFGIGFGTQLPLIVVFLLLLGRAVLVPQYRPTPKQAGLGEVAATLAVAATSLLA